MMFAMPPNNALHPPLDSVRRALPLQEAHVKCT